MSVLSITDYESRRRPARLPARVCPQKREVLTPRDIAVLDQMVADPTATNAELGLALGVGPDAIKGHLKRAFRILGADNRTHAILLWMEKQRRVA